MIEQVVKERITDIHSLRVGQMITQDYQKPTQRALTVVEVSDKKPGSRGRILWLESRSGEEITLTQADLDIRKYDLRTTPKRRSL